MQNHYLEFAKDPLHRLAKLSWKSCEPTGEAVLIAYEERVV
jgi:hypothetical protein